MMVLQDEEEVAEDLGPSYHDFTQRVEKGIRSTLILITAHEGTFDPETEPVGNANGIEKCVWQHEHGATYKVTECTNTPKTHIHVAVAMSNKRPPASVLDLIFPTTQAKGKDIRIPKNGVKFTQLAKYASKSTHRVEGTAPFYFNWDPLAAAAECKKRKMEEVVEAIQEMECRQDLSRHGETRGMFHNQTSLVTEVLAHRPMKRPVSVQGDLLYAWERSIIKLISRRPKLDEPVVHWFVPETQASLTKLDRIARIVSKVLSNKSQSQQSTFWSTEWEDTRAFYNNLQPHHKVIWIDSFSEKPFSHERLKRLQSKSLGSNNAKDRYGLVELEPRHLLVFSEAEPALDGPCHQFAKVWKIDTNKEEWKHESNLLACAEPSSTTAFLDFDTVGASGVLKAELQMLTGETESDDH